MTQSSCQLETFLLNLESSGIRLLFWKPCMYLICNNAFIFELAQNKQVPNQSLLLVDILEASLCHHSRGLLPPALTRSGWFGWVEGRQSEKSYPFLLEKVVNIIVSIQTCLTFRRHQDWGTMQVWVISNLSSYWWWRVNRHVTQILLGLCWVWCTSLALNKREGHYCCLWKPFTPFWSTEKLLY